MNTRIFGSIHAELLKIKRSSALAVSLIAPYLVVLMVLIFTLTDSGKRLLGVAKVSPWKWQGEVAFSVWGLLVLPLSFALVAALLAAIEHRASGFKYLLALPTSRSQIYIAKQVIAFGLVGLSFLLLIFGLLANGLLLRWLRPGLGFEDPLPITIYFQFGLRQFAAALLLIAIQTWVALIRRDFSVPLGLGLLATASLIAVKSFGSEWTVYHPWAYPTEAIRGIVEGNTQAQWSISGLVGSLIITAIAAWSFARRDVT